MKKIVVLFCFLFSLFLFSQENKTADKLVNEIQQVKQTSNSLKIVWWIPTEYWGIAIRDNNIQASNEQVDYLENLLNDYTIVVAGDFAFDTNDSNIDYKVKDFKDALIFTGLDGKKMTVLKDSEINENVLMIINTTLKPLFSKMLGQTGEGIEFFIYNNMKNGKRIIDPTKPGVFNIELNKENFHWTLPLVSLMKEKICPIDQQKMNGNWLYCPIHGEKL